MHLLILMHEEHVPDVVFVFVYIYIISVLFLENKKIIMPFPILLICVLVSCCSFNAVKCAKGKSKEVQVIKEVYHRQMYVSPALSHHLGSV